MIAVVGNVVEQVYPVAIVIEVDEHHEPETTQTQVTFAVVAVRGVNVAFGHPVEFHTALAIVNAVLAAAKPVGTATVEADIAVQKVTKLYVEPTVTKAYVEAQAEQVT